MTREETGVIIKIYINNNKHNLLSILNIEYDIGNAWLFKNSSSYSTLMEAFKK